MNSNVGKGFSEVVSVDAWQASIQKDGSASVHVDLSFLAGAVGAEDDFDITFRVALKRAVLRLVIPESEPLTVLQSSVDREQTLEGVRKRIEESMVAKSGAVGVRAQLKSVMPVKAFGEVRAAGSSKSQTFTEFSQNISQFRVRQYVDRDKCYC